MLGTTASRFCDAIITIYDNNYNEVLRWHAPHVYKATGVGCDVAKYMNADVDRAELRKSIRQRREIYSTVVGQ